jgi:hypothetical protein
MSDSSSSFKITKNDYIKILKYYNLNIPSKTEDIKKIAEKILSEKLCKCIKKVSPINEAKSIGVCTRAIFNRKGLTRGKFKCTGKKQVVFSKTKRNLTVPQTKNKTVKNKK